MGTQTDEESETSESESDNDDKRKKNRKDKPNRRVKKVNEEKDNSFWKGMLGSLFDASSWINSIEGRAAKVHSFMRGLSFKPFSPFTSINEESAGKFCAIFSIIPFMTRQAMVHGCKQLIV